MIKSEKDVLNCLDSCEKNDTCIGCPLNSLNSPECVSIMAREAKQLIEEQQKRITKLEQKIEKSVEFPYPVGSEIYITVNNKTFVPAKLYGINENGAYLVFVEIDKHKHIYDWFRKIYSKEEMEKELEQMEWFM